ncbi:hypothetical protein I3F58_11045 [Streptomyces sp. MUM 203J]|uniref:hypothetical protein n=1 Tax=Streptomyces sp. MUM 203J TaxID=2791990 RepID=UPI001F044707|nr:hypothetical protein [Streptomyces sp. MUM 203J]MCH0540094.1 hypothetical protein [Streptomyces sp. MUM 203J]
MTRETDTSSSGPQGRGGAAYPSGTPPYGTGRSQETPGDADTDAAAAAGEPEQPKTETTLTTRIRINIPGSRPIPPVVMRKPVGEGDGTEEEAAEPASDVPARRAAPEPESPAERTGANPRVQDEPKPAQRETGTSDWFAPRKPPTAADSAATGSAGSGAPGAGTGSVPGSGPAAGGNSGGYGATGRPAPPGPQADGPQGRGTRPAGPAMPYFSDGPEPPSGPTTGPALGTTHVPPEDPAPEPMGIGMGAGLGMSDDTAVLTPRPSPADPQSPRQEHPPQVSGDTLTTGIPVVPQDDRAARPGPFPMSGPAQVTREQTAPSGYDAYPPALDEPAPAAPAPTPAPETRVPASARPKKGRSKLVLAAVGLVTAAGVTYGAGLLLNHSDVPKGTTVLGVDIGGGTKEEAAQKLSTALGPRAARPLELSIGGEKETLAPDKAGLTLDTQATVRGAAGSDYNPVSVIGSLFGQERVAQPVIPVDEEKLAVALRDLAGGSGTVTEGTITFEPGKVTAVPGKSGKSLDIARSMISVRDAYRAQVETGQTKVVELPLATQQPTITQAELDRAMKEFAEPAMSGLITIQAGGRQIQFGPQRSLPQILSMKPVEGRLVEVYDKQAIDRLLDGVFDGITITKGDGQQHQLSADDVASAMQTALLGQTPAERTVEIDLDPQG